MIVRFLPLLLFLSCSARVVNPPVPPGPGDALFYGRNIYSPTLLNDGTHKMWYGGWQKESDYPNDNIYYRTSTDGLSWSSPLTVLTPEQMPVPTTHVNDPSVTKHLNEANGLFQYTMFYTVCIPPCNGFSDSQIWSAVSPDGVNWSDHQVLLTGGPSDASAVFEGGGWSVYFVDRLDQQTVRKVEVAGDRTVSSTVEVVYIDPNHIGNVEVFFDGTWQMFFNRFGANPTRVDIYRSVSWGPATLVIENKGAICATTAPGVLEGDLYFGQHHRIDGGCPIDQHISIQRRRGLE